MIQLKLRAPNTVRGSNFPDKKDCARLLSPQADTQWGTRAGDKAGWTAKSLNSPLSPSKSHTFPTISPSVSAAGFYMWHISCRSFAGWMWKHSERGEALRATAANFFQTSASGYVAGSTRLWGPSHLVSIFREEYCNHLIIAPLPSASAGIGAPLDTTQDSLNVILTPWSRPSERYLPHFS